MYHELDNRIISALFSTLSSDDMTCVIHFLVMQSTLLWPVGFKCNFVGKVSELTCVSASNMVLLVLDSAVVLDSLWVCVGGCPHQC